MDSLFSHSYLGCLVAALMGLQLGSFLNVVVWRLPLMMQRQWEAECAELQGGPSASQHRRPSIYLHLARIALLAKQLCVQQNWYRC